MPASDLDGPGATGPSSQRPHAPSGARPAQQFPQQLPQGAGPHVPQRTELPTDPDLAVSELYAAHWQRLVRLAWLLLRDQLAAEDVVQDAFVATHRSWSSIRETGRVVGYLQTAVVNGCRSVQRHNVVVDRQNRRDAGSADALGRATHESAESAVLRDAERDAMLAALETLPDRQREVLVLRYYGDLSEAQIAQSLDVAPGTVKAHAHRGLSTLRQAMTPGTTGTTDASGGTGTTDHEPPRHLPTDPTEQR